MFTGVSAFPLTPMRADRPDLSSVADIAATLAASGMDSITALGSTGSYAYLNRDERRRVVATTVKHAKDIPVLAGIGALRTAHVIDHARDALDAGASALLLAPMTYQQLSEDEVFGLFAEVSERLEVPVVVYDNPGTTHFTFTDELYGRLAKLPHVASIKIPPPQAVDATRRLAQIRSEVSNRVTIGISGDPFAAAALCAGADAWYSAIAGTLPQLALSIARPALSGDHDRAVAQSKRAQPLWDLFAQFGSLRVVAAIAEMTGLAPENCLPAPIQGLESHARKRVAQALDQVQVNR